MKIPSRSSDIVSPRTTEHALFGVDFFDFSFDDDCEWAGRPSTASDLKLARPRGGGFCAMLSRTRLFPGTVFVEKTTLDVGC